MSFWDTLKQEATDALPEVKAVIKKELQNQVSKRVNSEATAQSASPVSVNTMGGNQGMLLMVAGALGLFLILKRR